MRKPTPMAAQTLLDLLAVKHAADVFVPECKDGPSQGTWHFRMDAWAMNRSWSNPVVWGYEIKVTRQDFLKDDKWQAYLPCCTEFYFVCQADLIKPEELPPEVGLLYAASTGTRLFTKKKAQRRNIELPESVYRYILMCRAQVGRRYYDDDNATFWRKWLGEKIENRRLGSATSRAIRDTVNAQISAVETENRELRARIKTYEEIKQCITAAGFTADEYCDAWAFRRKTTELKSIIDEELHRQIRRSAESLQSLVERIDELQSLGPVEAVANAKEKK